MHTIIKPHKGLVPLDLKELWRYKDLLYIFTWRDIKVRYKQTIFGVAWAIVQPFVTMLIFTIFFGVLANISSGGIPYPLFAYSALIPWTFFSNGVTRASRSLENDSNLLQKIYFPRLLIPTASIVAPLVDFIFSMVVIGGMLWYYHYALTTAVLFLPIFLIMEIVLALGISYWLSAINVEYRDVAFATPFLMQIWMFASPIIYSTDYIPEKYQLLYNMANPMVGIINGFRWSLLDVGKMDNMIYVSAGMILLIFVTGLYYFKYRERAFADVV